MSPENDYALPRQLLIARTGFVGGQENFSEIMKSYLPSQREFTNGWGKDVAASTERSRHTYKIQSPIRTCLYWVYAFALPLYSTLWKMSSCLKIYIFYHQKTVLLAFFSKVQRALKSTTFVETEWWKWTTIHFFRELFFNSANDWNFVQCGCPNNQKQCPFQSYANNYQYLSTFTKHIAK